MICVRTAVLVGVEARLAEVSVDGNTLSAPLADGELEQARELVRATLRESLTDGREWRTQGASDDQRPSAGVELALACALLQAEGRLPPSSLEGTLVWGTMNYGSVQGARGAFAAAEAGRRSGLRRVLVAPSNAREVALSGLEVVVVESIDDLLENGGRVWSEPPSPPQRSSHQPDLSDIRGLAMPRQALEVMVAGAHNLLLHGPPGVGKTMLARRIAGIMPSLDPVQARLVTQIHSTFRETTELVTRPPIRMPHHTVSTAGLLGGGRTRLPGEVTLAHGGVLFLDELPEFPRASTEGLREPLTEGITRLYCRSTTSELPAKFLLMAAMNDCPCGFLTAPNRACTDSPAAVERYQSRVHTLLPFFGLSVAVEAPREDDPFGEPSAAVLERVELARARQGRRYGVTFWARSNGTLPWKRLAGQFKADVVSELAARRPESELTRLLGVARTLADLDPNHPEDALLGREWLEKAAGLWAPPTTTPIGVSGASR